MLGDMRKSINSILYERTTSPFWGTILVSWLIWNWKIIYLTVFISEDKIKGTKIDYILSNCINNNYLFTYPLLSSLILLTVIPFLSNGAFWLSIQFDKWKIDQRNTIERKQLITVEQSIELREQILNQELRFEKLLEIKNNEIKDLKIIIEAINEKSKVSNVSTREIKTNHEFEDLAAKIKNSKELLDNYNTLIHFIQRSYRITEDDGPSAEIIALLESYDVIENASSGIYRFTKSGKSFQKYMA